MKRTLVFVMVVGASWGARASTATSNSAAGLIDTRPPVFSALNAKPARSPVWGTVRITFSASEALEMIPSVLVNGHVAQFLDQTESDDYTYTYWPRLDDPPGMATVELAGWDFGGNRASLSSATVLEILDGPPVPVYAWPLFLMFVLAGMGVLRRPWAGHRASKLFFIALLFGLTAATAAAFEPTVSNVAFTQYAVENGTRVDITYDLSSVYGPCDVSLSLSKDAGAGRFVHPVTSVTGDVGAGVTPGIGKRIVWNAAADYPNETLPEARIQVAVDDGFVAPEMLPVPAGPFEMGASSVGDDAAYGDACETPVHTVMLSTYEIGKFEVTNQQICDVYNWAKERGYFTLLNAATATAHGQELLDLDELECQITLSAGDFIAKSRDGYSMANFPVVEMSWYGAVAYCNWLSEIRGVTPAYNTLTWTANFSNGGYHLPTEAQWERAAACREAKHWTYGFCSDRLTGKNTCNYRDNNPGQVNPLGLSAHPCVSPVGWFDGVNTSPNGSVLTRNSRSPLGCYDMSGNVSEWCHDYFVDDYYTSGGPLWSDPSGPHSAALRAVRGASADSVFQHCRAARRDSSSPDATGPYRGFRLARSLPGAGDGCGTALVITEGIPLAGSTVGSVGTDITSCAFNDSVGIWFAYTPPEDSLASISTEGSALNTTLAVYDTCGGTELDCNDDVYLGAGWSRIKLDVTGGETYRIRLAGQNRASGDYVLAVNPSTRLDVPEMIPVAAGTFTMGRSDNGDDASYGRPGELPRHDVMLSAYEIGKFEVTNQQVCDVYNWAHDQGHFTALNEGTAAAYGEELLDLDYSWCHIEYRDGELVPEVRMGLAGTAGAAAYSMAPYPVVEISWYGAVVYCNWLSELEGLTPVYNTSTWAADASKDGYRLPTEAQWERAAAWDSAAVGGPKHWIYGFTSDTLTDWSQANHWDFVSLNWVNPRGLTRYPYTSPKGWFDGGNVSPNPQPSGVLTLDGRSPVGCYDMSGNVWEWCNDWYSESYYAHSPERDPQGPASGTHRVLRGGSWRHPNGYCRSAAREPFEPGNTYYSPSFRVARLQQTVPAVVSFAINDGADSVAGFTVTLDNVCAGLPAEYLASEASDFAGAVWLPYDAAPRFSVSPSAGTKTVYFKLRNAKGASETVSDSIEVTGASVPEMIPVPAGTFTMGRRDDGDDGTHGDDDELPRHEVTLSAYEIGRFEVTNQQVCDVYNWADDQGYFTTVDAEAATAFGQNLLTLRGAYCLIEYSGGVFAPETRTGLADTTGTAVYSMASHPVVRINRYGAVAYCNWLSEIEGLTPVYNTSTWAADFSNDGYHLPTEAQWERAAAWDGSQHWIYGFTSDTLTGKNRANHWDDNPRQVNPLGLSNYPYTSPVGWFDGTNVSPNPQPSGVSTLDSASPVGCFGMSGNVWEWCHDWYSSSYYGSSPRTDPEGPVSGHRRLLRGGSWRGPNYRCRSACRDSIFPDNTSYEIGFRVARTLKVAPLIASFAINGGAPSTAGLTVTLDNACAGVPSEYMASEDSDFSGAAWQAYDTAPSFTLSAGFGAKTVYFKVRNAKGESAAVSDSIAFTDEGEPGLLAVSPDVLVFPLGTDQVFFDVLNTSGDSVTWHTTPPVTWLLLNPQTGSLGTGQSVPVYLTVDRAQLAGATEAWVSATITVLSDTGSAFVEVIVMLVAS